MIRNVLKGLGALVLVGAMVSLALAAGTVTQTVTNVAGQNAWKGTLAFSADGAGQIDNVDMIVPINGYVVLTTVNHGSTACADDMDIYLYDTDGVDILGATMVDLAPSTTDTQQFAPAIGSTYGARYVQGVATAAFTETATANCFGDFSIYWVK